MAQLSGPDGKPLELDGEGNRKEAPGLDMANPPQSLELLGSVGRGCYIMAAQYAHMAGPKGERHVKVLAKDLSSVASQGAAVAEFASNVISELAFTLAEAEARVAVLLGSIPEDLLQAAKERDLDVAVEWENRRRLFSGNIAILMKERKRLGPALAEAIAGAAPTEEDFKAQTEAAKAAGLDVQEATQEGEPAQPAPAEEAPKA